MMTTVKSKRSRKAPSQPQPAAPEDPLTKLSKGGLIVDLSRMELGDLGARKVADSLGSCAVTNLQLPWNNIWADGARAIATALCNNETIERLDLGHNNIGNYGASYIADCLSQNKRITALYLNDNGIDDEGAACLLDNINDRLCELNLVCNPISNRSILARIQEKLESNRIRRRMEVMDSRVNKDHQQVVRGLEEELQVHKERYAELQRSVEQLKKQHQQSRKTLIDDHARELEKRAQVERGLAADVERLSAEVRDAEAKVARAGHDTARAAQDAARAREDVARAAQDVARARADAAVLSNNVQGLNAQRANDATNFNNMKQARDNLLRRQGELERRLLSFDLSHMHEDTDVEGLSKLEDELESVLKHVRAIKVKKLQFDGVPESKKCKVCFEERVDTLLLPCAHLILCQGCSNKVQKCPLCSKPIASRVHVFEG